MAMKRQGELQDYLLMMWAEVPRSPATCSTIACKNWTPPRTAFWRVDVHARADCWIDGPLPPDFDRICRYGLTEAGSLAWSCRRRPRRQPEHPLHIVGEIGETDFHFRPD